MKLLDKISLVLLILLSCSASGKAGVGQDIEVYDYKIQVFTEQNGQRLEVYGQVIGGNSCEALLINMECTSKYGDAEEVNVVVKDITGAGSRLFRTDTKVRNKSYEDWSISNVYVWCNTGKSVSVREYPSKILIYGEGNSSPGYINLKKGLNIFRYSHIGSKHFSILLKDKTGNPIELIANHIGKKKGLNSVFIEDNGEYSIEVDASSRALWSIYIIIPKGEWRSNKTKNETKQMKSLTPATKSKNQSLRDSSNNSLKIWEDEKGVIHLEQ